MATKVCRFVTIFFAALYLVALLLLAIGTFGLFGAEKDPLSAVFLVPLGVPWIYLADALPEAFGPWVGIAAPAINLAIIVAICRLLRRAPG